MPVFLDATVWSWSPISLAVSPIARKFLSRMFRLSPQSQASLSLGQDWVSGEWLL